MSAKSFKGFLSATDGSSSTAFLVRYEVICKSEFEGLPIPIPRSRDAVVDKSGEFTVSLLDKELLEPTSTIEVFGPTGSLIFSSNFKQLVDSSKLVDSTSGDTPTSIDIAPGMLAGRVVANTGNKVIGYTVGGRIINLAGESAPPKTVVRVFARATSGDKPSLVFQTLTDARGYFRGPRMTSSFHSAFAVIQPSNSGDNHSIALTDDGYLPDPIIIVVDSFPEDSNHDCICDEPPTQNPDSKDLATAGDVFSTDLGTSRCVDFSIPNRTLEEFSFYQIVRTTDSAIKGPSVLSPQPLPPALLDEIKKLGFGISTLESGFGNAVTISATPLSKDVRTTGGSGRVLRLLNTLRRRVLATRNSTATPANSSFSIGSRSLEARLDTSAAKAIGATDAKTWRETMGNAASTLESSELRLSPEALLDAVADVDGFTPVNLMSAERASIRAYLEAILLMIERRRPGRQILNEDNPIDWDDTPEFYQSTTIAHGHVLQFKQEWKAAGYSLGELVQSIPLAPCQKKQIVTLDWDRQEIQAREESLTNFESLAAEISRDRDINEIANASFRERSDGASEADVKGGGVGIGFAIGPLVIGGGGGASNASSSAWQNSSRNVSMNSLNQLRDQTSQGAAAVRSQRATVVQALQQGERVSTTTEVIANHNHCHALTVQYFEVLRHFSVAERISSVRECLFIPLLMTPFNDFKILRWKDALYRSCRRRELRPAFEAIERLNDGSFQPQGAYADDPIRELQGRLRIRVSITRPRDLAEEQAFDIEQLDPGWRLIGMIMGKSPSDLYQNHRRNVALRDQIFQNEIAPEVARRVLESLEIVLIDENGTETAANLDTTVVSRYREGLLMRVDLNDSGETPSLTRRSIVGVAVRTNKELPEFSRVVLERAILSYRTDRLKHRLYASNRVLDDIAQGDEAYLPTDLLSFQEERNPHAEDEEARRLLLKHLNSHIAYYHRSIWLSLDAERRFMLLDGFVAPNANGRSVAAVVENRVIGVVGNCLVMPVAPGFQLDPVLRDAIKQTATGNNEPDPAAILDYIYRPLTPVVPRRISVPTKGVFAEAVQGKCNSCEVIDETLFWRWSESPCPDDPPAIDPVSTDSRRATALDTTPTALPQSVVAYQQLATAPDPTGTAMALDLLSKNIFKDITGLALNQANSIGLLQQSLAAAQSFAGEAASLSNAQAASRDLDKNIASIQQAKDAKLLTPEEASSAARDAIMQSLGEPASAKPSASEAPAITSAIESAIKEPGAEVSITREGPGGSESIEVSTPPASTVLTEGAAFTPHFDTDVDSLTFLFPFTFDDLRPDAPNVRLDWDIKPAISSFSDFQDSTLHFQTIDGSGDRVYFDLAGTLKENGHLAENGAGAMLLKAKVRICYPRSAADPRHLSTTKAQYPVVGIIHGQAGSYTLDTGSGPSKEVSKTVHGHSSKLRQYPIVAEQDNHLGYEFLQEELARHGIVSISVSTNVANRFNAMVRARSNTLMGALQALKSQSALVASAASPLFKYKNKLDFSNVALLGHSRGGEAVVDAKRIPKGIGIRGICALAPTDFNGIAESNATGRYQVDAADNIPYLCIYGSFDGDVANLKSDLPPPFDSKNPWSTTGTGFRIYDRCTGHKAFVFVPGANHKRFNAIWNTVRPDPAFNPGEDPMPYSRAVFGAASPVLTHDQHKTILKTYAGNFLRLILNRESSLEKWFRGDQLIRFGANDFHVMNQWQFGNNVRFVDNFNGQKIGTTTIVGGSVLPFAPNPGGPSAFEKATAHVTNSAVFDLTSSPPASVSIQHDFGAGSLQDLTAYDNFNFRLAYGYDTTNEASIAATPHPTFTTVFEDDAGGSLTLKSSSLPDYKRFLRPDFVVVNGSVYGLSASLNKTTFSFQTIRVPLAFVSAPPAGSSGSVKPDKIRKVSIVFDTSAPPTHIVVDSMQLIDA